VYIVNLYPAIEKKLPQDPDLILGRDIDIKFKDRTKYDFKIAEMTTDYIDIIKELHDIAQDRELPKQAKEILSKNIKDILDKDAKRKKAQ
jgi:NTE family protein